MISKSFTLEELTKSDIANKYPEIKKKQDNPPIEVIKNLRRLTIVTLQPIRDEIGIPIHISSAWRCDELNEKVGSSKFSQHPLGEAADITVLEHSPVTYQVVQDHARALCGKEIREDASPTFYLFAFIAIRRERLDIDQIIHEFGDPGIPDWAHVSSSSRMSRREIKIIGKGLNKILTLEEALLLGC